MRIRTGAFLGFLAVFFMMGCGDQPLTGKSDQPIEVKLEIPPQEDPEIFWFDVEKRLLRITTKEESFEVSWTSGSNFEQDLDEGDQLIFEGFSSDGLLLVRGSAMVGKSKNLSIPVVKVL
jgi:hypothetical protein